MMGTECVMATLSGDPEPSIPPGFGPFVVLALKGIQNSVKPGDAHSTSAQAAQCMEKDVEILEHNLAHGRSGAPASTSGSHSCRRSLRNRPPIDYSQFDLISDEESDVESPEKGVGSVRRRRQLPKGVLRGCAECADCQKVVARWNPSGARRPVLEEAPVFYPSEEEFKDTLKYIESIRSMAEPYGICRIVPPPSWKPPCLLKEKTIWESTKFSTRVQKVDKLQNRKSSKKSRRGGMMKRRKLLELEDNSSINNNQTGMQQNQERFGFEPGPEFTLETFKKYADDFSEQYFKQEVSRDSVPSVKDIEGEYWRIVERPTEEIEVVYGADLETGTFGSGFPKFSPEVKSDVEHKYAESGWNLNNLPRLQGSVLSFEGGDISGVLVPWVYVGMCFSSFCWHVEDHHLYSLNYMHWGAPKMWYGVPGKDAVNLEAAMRKHLPDLFEEQPDLLHNLVTQFSPTLLKSEGVPVYRCVQHEGEFVLTFPRAYHAGFNCGFNCAEAVNVAPIDWLPIGQDAVEIYRHQARKITVSHDKLLLGAAREAIRAQWDILFHKRNTADNLRWKSMCGLDSTICKSLKARIDMELVQRQNICSPSQSRKMDAEFDSTERECALCYYDLHLSASGCPCCPEKYACLVHAKQLCSCDWDKRFFLFRYDVNELNLLADALGGKLSAIHRWGVSHLGLSLSSCIKREKDQDSKTLRRVTDGPRRSYMSQASAVSLAPLLVCNEQNNNENKMLGTSSLKMDTSGPFSKQIKSGNVSLQKETHTRNEVSCTLNNSVSPEVHKGSLNFPFTTGQSFSSNFATRSLSTSGESMKNAYGLRVFEGSRESSQSGDCISSLGVHHNIPPMMVHQGSNMNPSMESSNNSHRLIASNTNAIQCHSYKDQMHVTPETGACASSSQPFVRTVLRAQSVSQEASAESSQSRDCISSLGVHHNIPPMMADQGSNVNPSMESSNNSHRLIASNTNAIQCHSYKDQMHVTPETRACASSSQPFLRTVLRAQSVSQEASAGVFASEPLISSSLVKNTYGGLSSCGVHLGHPNFGNQQPSDGCLQRKSESLCGSESRGHPVSVVKPTLENHNRNGGALKGPRIANVVHRFRSLVEPLEIGIVLSGRLWSSSQAIFPKGFRSRVKYFSIVDPTQMAYYISEILDAGPQGPLFMVTLENCPGELFINISPTKCWSMVRERLNMEIRRQLSMGRANLPALQPPGSVDGIEMFGLLSPSIVQAIEALDRDHICIEYWRSRPHIVTEDRDSRRMVPSQAPGPLHALRELFQRASYNELLALRSLLVSNSSLDDFSRQQAAQILDEEIAKQRR